MLNPLFLQRMKDYLGNEEEYQAFLDSYNLPNIRSFRVNDKKINPQMLMEIFDLAITPIAGLDNAFKVDEECRFGFHPLHHAGAFYLQDPSAMLPALSYPKLADCHLVLDLCAAPGGKTIELASQLKDGVVIANEIDEARAKILYSNVERMGLKNVIITNNKAEDFLKDFTGAFDLILVDAPCSGEGMFRKYPESQAQWSLENVLQCAKRDKEILAICDKLLKKAGILIYSTCTFAKEEDEEIVEYLENELSYSLIEANENIQKFLSPGFKDKGYRIYPHHHFGEGQFFAVLKKNNGSTCLSKIEKSAKINSPLFASFVRENLISGIDNLIQTGDKLFYKASDLFLSNLRVLNYGVKLGHFHNNRFIPDHFFFKAFPELFKSQLELDYRDERIKKYLHGEEIIADVKKGYGVILVNGVALGGYKASNQVLKNHYPKGLRNF